MGLSVEDLKNMPLRAKKLFDKAYTKALSAGYDDDTSANIAFSAVSEMFVYEKGVWNTKSKAKVSAVVGKSGFFFPKFNVQAVLTSSSLDDHGEIVDEDFVKSIGSNSYLLEDLGDINHKSTFSGDKSFKGMFKLLNKEFKDGKVLLDITANKAHNRYKEAVNWLKSKYDRGEKIALSADFFNPVVKGNRIVGASKVGWSVVEDPSNKDAYQV